MVGEQGMSPCELGETYQMTTNYQIDQRNQKAPFIYLYHHNSRFWIVSLFDLSLKIRQEAIS